MSTEEELRWLRDAAIKLVEEIAATQREVTEAIQQENRCRAMLNTLLTRFNAELLPKINEAIEMTAERDEADDADWWKQSQEDDGDE